VPLFSCDFHIHSTLSPCSSLEMSSRGIVDRAREVGLDIIAITDHNMVENGPYAVAAAGSSGPVVLFGMELQTIEEVHLLVLFPDYETALEMQEMVYDLLPPIENDPDYFGDQVVVDENDRIVRFEGRLLLNSSNISVNDAASWARAHGSLVIPSHIDSPTFGIITQLGYVSQDIPFDALEVASEKRLKTVLPFVLAKDLPIVTFSDAHYLKDIGKRRISLSLGEPTFSEVAAALRAFGNTARAIEEKLEEESG
jgi:3',5'-nucleoside bisphosphate phosphatase